MRIEMVVCQITIIFRINQIDSSEINSNITTFNIRNDVYAIPKMNGVANAVSQPIGSVRIIRILNSVVCVAILCTKQAIRIACNKRAVLIDRQRISVRIVAVNLIGYTRGLCKEAV